PTLGRTGLRSQVIGLGGNADYWGIGSRIEWRILEVGIVYGHEHNGDLVTVPLRSGELASVAFNATGFETYERVAIGRFAVIGGFTYEGPRVRTPLLNPN